MQLERWAYIRADEWKKSYRYTLVNDFRTHISEAKCAIIKAFELPNKFKEQKLYLYSMAQGELSIIESDMDIMICDEVNVMSEKEWSRCEVMIEEIRVSLSKIQNSLRNTSGSDSPDCGMGSVPTNHKDA